MTNYGVVIVACSPGYRSSSIVVCYFVSTVNLYCIFMDIKKMTNLHCVKYICVCMRMCVYACVRTRVYTSADAGIFYSMGKFY